MGAGTAGVSARRIEGENKVKVMKQSLGAAVAVDGTWQDEKKIKFCNDPMGPMPRRQVSNSKSRITGRRREEMQGG